MLIYALIAGNVLSALPPVFAREHVSRKHRELFLSPALKKDFYKIEVQTVKFLNRQQSHVNHLIESFRGTSIYAYDIFTHAFSYGKGGVLDAQSFTYDGAVAALAYLIAGQERKAAQILGVYRKEFYSPKGDMPGLFNSYRTDVVGVNNLVLGIDGDRIHLGPTMWVGIAALQYTALTGDLQFMPFIIDLAKWAQHLHHYEFPDGQKGAACMGVGWGPDWSVIYSTENNIDYYALLSMLDDIYRRGDSRVKNLFKRKNYGPRDIDSEMFGIARWMKEVAYNTDHRYFNCGYNEKGSDKTKALDTVSWTIASFGPQLLEDMEVDPFALMGFAEKNFLVKCTVAGQEIRGFDLTDYRSRRKPQKMVWFEGTGQQIVAYQIMWRYAKRRGMKAKAEEYRSMAVKLSDDMEKVSAALKLPERSLPYVSKRAGEKEIIFTFADEWEIPRGNKGQWVSSVSSTVWRYFALAGFNPLAFDLQNVNYKLFSRAKRAGRPAKADRKKPSRT